MARFISAAVALATFDDLLQRVIPVNGSGPIAPAATTVREYLALAVHAEQQQRMNFAEQLIGLIGSLGERTVILGTVPLQQVFAEVAGGLSEVSDDTELKNMLVLDLLTFTEGTGAIRFVPSEPGVGIEIPERGWYSHVQLAS